MIIAYTLAGDANLDGTVNFADLLVVAQNFNHMLDTHGNALDWADGDFNYDGAVNFADLLLVSQNFNKKLASGEISNLPGSYSDDSTLSDEVIDAEEITLYVDPTAADSDDSGTSWANAFPDVQSALGTAQTIETDSPGTTVDIDVAQGTYTPGASGVFQPDALLFNTSRARRTFSMMSSAFAVHSKDCGFSLCASM